jgi:hypothetical protein
MTVRARIIAGALAIVLGATGCAHRTVGGQTVYKTVTTTPPAPTPTPTQSPTTSPVADTSSASKKPPKPSPKPKVAKLPGTCKSLLDADSINKVLGQKLTGSVQYAVGRGDSTINRLAFIDCKYGLIRGKAPAVEIRVSLYRSAGDASDRIRATVQDFELHGAAASTTKIGGQPATLLLGANLLTYGPTLVKVAGVRTIAVTLRPGWDNVQRLLPRLGGLALRKTTPR